MKAAKRRDQDQTQKQHRAVTGERLKLYISLVGYQTLQDMETIKRGDRQKVKQSQNQVYPNSKVNHHHYYFANLKTN